MQELLESVRKVCAPGLWSQGVKLAREAKPRVERRSDTEIVLRVTGDGRAVAPTVVLYPEDAEWTCDCGGKVDPCAHVAAAVIALTQAEQRGEALTPEASREPKLGYRLERHTGTLAVRRVLVHADGREEPLALSLASSIARGASGLTVSQEDLTLDRIAGARAGGVVQPHRLPEVLAALAEAADVRLAGAPVVVSREAIAPRVIVEDAAGGGVVLHIERDPRVREVIAPGVALCEGALHPLSHPDLTGPALERLPIVRRFAPGELGELVTTVLPDLERKLAVEVRSRRLPRTGAKQRPRIALNLTQDGHTLSVLPTLVYGDPPVARVDGGKLVHLGGEVPLRDEATERELVQRLRDELNLVPGRRVDFDGNEAVRFASRLEGWSDAIEGAGGARPVRGATLVPRLVVRGDAFDLTFDVPEDELEGAPDSHPAKKADPAAVLRAWRDGLGLAPLDGGGWARLPEGWLSRYGALVADLLAARRDDGELAPVALPALAELCDALELPPPPGLARLAPLFERFERLPDAELPQDLTATLRSYQRVGVNWMSFLREAGLGAVLADDMGLGKTLQALCALKGRTLVVCPRSVVHNWADEIRRFRPSLQVCVYHGTRRALDPTADVTLTTYAVLRLDAEALTEIHWDTVVLDEAQNIKNPDSQMARAAYGLEARFRLSLSGTPIENRLEELWSQMHFTNPGLLGGRTDFRDRYATPIDGGDADASARLRRRVRPFVMRRRKSEVAPELPPRTEVTLHVELEERERAVYDAVRAATQKELVAKLAEDIDVLAALEALLRLRQAACHPALVPGQTAETSSKVDRLVEALEDAAADGHKALVFSQWTSFLDLVEPHLERANIGFTRLDGSTRDRAAVVSAFQAADGPPVMLLSLKAGGTGLNLTAADHVFLLDPWWNPAVEDQAADRAHRIGQDRPVMVYRLVARDTVEEGILALQGRKRALAESAVGGADAARSITRDDLLALLK